MVIRPSRYSRGARPWPRGADGTARRWEAGRACRGTA